MAAFSGRGVGVVGGGGSSRGFNTVLGCASVPYVNDVVFGGSLDGSARFLDGGVGAGLGGVNIIWIGEGRGGGLYFGMRACVVSGLGGGVVPSIGGTVGAVLDGGIGGGL